MEDGGGLPPSPSVTCQLYLTITPLIVAVAGAKIDAVRLLRTAFISVT